MSNLLEEHIKGRIFIRRMLILAFFQTILVILLISRLVYLQVISFNEFRSRSENNHINISVIPPIRGNILDRSNIPLTTNRNSYELILYRNRDRKTHIDEIVKLLNLRTERERKIRKQLKNNSNRQVISLISNLTWEELVKISYRNHLMTNIATEEGHMRHYPYGEEFAHIIGYVAPPDEREIKKLAKKIDKNTLFHPNFRIGKNGLEAYFNSELTGKSGYKKTEVNAFNVPSREIERRESEKGEDIKLTIDSKLQRHIYHSLKDKGLRAAVVVLNVKTGEILALVSVPSYNPNEFIDGIANDYWNQLTNDEAKPLYNKTLSALYALGSTFKPLISIAALENGWDENRKIECKGLMKINNKLDFHCWKREGGHGKIDIVEALERSCNIFFANLSLFAGIHSIEDTAKKLGIGEVFDINLPEYNNGIMPGPSWKREYHNESWTKGDTINISIGQGYLTANPLQLAVMVSRIANGGYSIKPFLTYNNPLREENRKLFEEAPIFSEKTIATVKQGMFNVVNSRSGTAGWLRPRKNNKNYQIGGKTGTAQVISMEMRERLEKELKEGEKLDLKYRHHGLFIGFAPHDEPKYGVAVVVEHGDSGSLSAAPVAVDVLKYVLDNEPEEFEKIEKTEKIEDLGKFEDKPGELGILKI